MKALVHHIRLQWRLDLRNKNVLLPYYIIPLIFFLVMSAVFNSIMPDYGTVLIPAMIVFSVTMASVLGMPVTLFEIYGTDIKKMFHLGNVPSFVPLVVSLIASFLHFLLLSLIIIVLGIIIYDAVVPSSLGVFVPSMLGFILASEGVGALIGMFAKKQSDIAIMGQAVFLPSIILSGAMFSADLLPDILQYVSYILPASLGMNAMAWNEGHLWMILALFLVFAASVAVSVFRSKSLK